MLRKILIWAIGLFFLLYGLVRVASGAMLTNALLVTGEHDGVQEGLDTIISVMDDPAQFEIIPFNSLAYIAYITFMGLILILGTVGALLSKRWGSWLMSCYFVLYLFLFLNFLVFNIKVVYLTGSFVLFLLFLWLKKKNASIPTS